MSAIKDRLQDDWKAALKAKEKEVIEKLKENQMIADTAQVASNYLSWVLETVKRPMTKASGFNSLYTYLTLGIIVIFAALSTTLNLHAFYERTVVNTTFSEFSSFVGISARSLHLSWLPKCRSL